MTNSSLIFSFCASGLWFLATTFYCLANKFMSSLRDVVQMLQGQTDAVYFLTNKASQTVLFPGGCRW